MLLKELYVISEKKADANGVVHIRLKLQKAHEVFAGHFPGHPVLPGVAMLQMVKEFSEEHLERSLLMQQFSQVKFLALVDPSVASELNFTMHFERHTDGISVKNTTTFPDGSIVLKCNVTFVVTNDTRIP